MVRLYLLRIVDPIDNRRGGQAANAGHFENTPHVAGWNHEGQFPIPIIELLGSPEDHCHACRVHISKVGQVNKECACTCFIKTLNCLLCLRAVKMVNLALQFEGRGRIKRFMYLQDGDL